MKSIYIICLIAAINANMENELDLVYKHYDAMVDIAEIKYGGNCQTEINDLMDLLCFQYCPSNGDCMDKSEYRQFVTNYCDLYEEVDYSIHIKPNKQYAPTYTSLTCKWTFLTTDGCTMKVNEQHKLYYNDEGLITKFHDELISEHTECPQSGYVSDPEPTVEYPQETAYLGGNYREYANIRPVQIAGGDPTYNGFNKVTNPTELEYIAADLGQLQDEIAESVSTELVGVSLIDAYSKRISENQIRYRCRTELEEVGPNYGKDDGIVLRIFIEYDVILITKSQETNAYIEDEPSTTQIKYAEENKYIEEPANEYKPQATTTYAAASTTEYPQNEYDATKLAKNDIISGLVDYVGDVMCKSNKGKAEDGINVFCIDAEYDAICDNDADDDACAMFAGSIPGRDEVLLYFKQYENIFDEATSLYDSINDRLIILYRKGSCQGEYSERVEFEYDEERQCISKWTEYLGDIITSDEGCHNSAAAFIRKIFYECKFDDEIDNEYIGDEPSSTADECQNNADGINKFFEAIPVAAGDCGKDDIDHLMALFSDDFIYNEVEDGIDYTLNKTEYEQAVLKSCDTYKTADFALSPISCNSVTVEWKLTFIDGCTLTKMDEQEFVFNSQGLITRKSSRIISDSSIICPLPTEYKAEPSTTPLKYDEENAYIEEPENEYKPQATTAYDSPSITKLAKNNIISGLVDHFGDVLCKSKAGKAEDGINVFCDDAEYDAICDNNADDDACSMFAGSIPGRDGVLQYFKQYEDIFDEATSRYDFINDRLITLYRKGSCQGQYSQRIEFEYDEQRQCISKWTEYLGDIITSDKGCHNSAAAFNRKILIECKFDDEIDNEYIKDEPSTTSGYESETDFDTTVNGYEECEPVTTRAYEGSPMLRKKEREMKVKAFYEAAFECRSKRNKGNTQLLDTFMNYFGDSAELCIAEDNACYNKNELREAMEYTDGEDLIDYQVEIMSNDACKIESKCVSHRKKSNGCIVTKEEYDTCLFNKDGSIKEFTVKRSNSRIDCDHNDDE